MREEMQRLRRELDELRKAAATSRPAEPQAIPRRPTTSPAAARDELPPLFGKRPVPRPLAVASDSVSDKDIGDAIARAVEFLLTRVVDDNGQLRFTLHAPQDRTIYADPNDPSLNTGMHALVTYALLQAGLAIRDERLDIKRPLMKQMVERLKRLDPDGGAGTYARALRIAALAVYNRSEDRKVLGEDATYLVNNIHGGCYTYGSLSARYSNLDRTIRFGDNSNAQYGLLGVWLASELGFEVRREYWHMVESHWAEAQHENGQWGYTPRVDGAAVTVNPAGGDAVALPRFIDPTGTRGTLSMTLAGAASLFVTHDYLDAGKFEREVGRDPFSPALARALKWLEDGDNIRKEVGPGRNGWGGGYTLYGIERVGLASGFRYFGKHDWYREFAQWLIEQQQPDGSFNDIIETAYCLLFLARGRHPIIMNKLRFEGSWANRPRDLANLARFASRELERPLNWQVVPLGRDWTQWNDSPVLYLASHLAVKLTDADCKNIRSFIDAGGLLFTHSDGSSPAFNGFVVQLGRKLYPAYEWVDVPADHEIFSVQFKVAPHPRLHCITNGSRILIVHSPNDISSSWQTRAERTRRNVFDLGVNLFLYAAGKTDLRNRLASPYLPPPPVNPTARMPLARIKYAGNWDPEPSAWTHFSRLLQYQTGLGLAPAEVTSADLNPSKYPIAHLTGAAPLRLADSAIADIRRYVEGGGVLLIDACGGSAAFDASITALLAKAFPTAKPQAIAPEHVLLAGGAPAMDQLPKPLVRALTIQKMSRAAAKIMSFRAGRGCVTYSPLDLTTGILGANTYNILGYTPAYAQSFVKNVILWTWDGMPEN